MKTTCRLGRKELCHNGVQFECYAFEFGYKYTLITFKVPTKSKHSNCRVYKHDINKYDEHDSHYNEWNYNNDNANNNGSVLDI